MPEQTYTPPETKYEVHIDELMKAIKGEPFEEGKGLYRMKGEEIERGGLLRKTNISLEKEQAYIILIETKLVGGGIVLQTEQLHDWGIGFIFYKSILPNMRLSNCKMGASYYINSQSGNISIAHNSQCGDIGIIEYSQVEYISVFEHSQSNNIHINTNSQSSNIAISTNSQVDHIYVENSSQSGTINISGHSKSQAIFVNNDSQVSDIRISDKSITGNIHIQGNSQAKAIAVRNFSKVGNIGIENNSRIEKIEFRIHCQAEGIYINGNQKAFPIDISANCQTGRLVFENALLSQIDISNALFGLSLYNTQFFMFKVSHSLISSFTWQSGARGELYVNQSQVLHLQVANTTLLKDSVLSLSDTQLQYGVLNEVLVQGSLLLRKLLPPSEAFAWRDIATYLGPEPENDGDKQLWNSKKELLEKQQKDYNETFAQLEKQFGPNPLFRISHSSMGKTEITGCDLSNFQFQYYNSNLLGCFITGTHLPKRNMVVYNPSTGTVLPNNLHSKELYEQKTAIYNQFKKIYENQGDVVEAYEFHAQAMRWQQKLLWDELRHGNNSFWKKVKLFFENLGFRLNWFSNNHGESWLLALVFTVAVSLLFFTASIWGLTHWGDWPTLGNNIHKLPGFMLPTHSIDYLSKDILTAHPHLKVNLWHTSWDFLGRIFIGYGFFQFVAAFRRHGKKG
jgi:hypothetical protein